MGPRSHLDATQHLVGGASTTVTSLRQMPSPLGSICAVSQSNLLSGLLWSTWEATLRESRHGKCVMSQEKQSINPTSGNLPLLFDEEQAAAFLSLSTRKLWELAACGAVKFIKIGALKRYRRCDLEEWVGRGCPTGKED